MKTLLKMLMLIYCAIALITVFAFSGCTTAMDPNYQPVMDFAGGKDATTFYSELAECKNLAAQRMSAGQAAALGTGIGAALGAAVGVATSAIFGADLGTGAAAGALFGGVSGATSGADADLNQKDIIIRCLQNRGYAVLGR